MSKLTGALGLTVGLLAALPAQAQTAQQQTPLLERVDEQLRADFFNPRSVPSELTANLIFTAFDQALIPSQLHAANDLYIVDSLGNPERSDLDDRTLVFSQFANLGDEDQAQAYSKFNAWGGTAVAGFLFNTQSTVEDFSPAPGAPITTLESNNDEVQLTLGYGHMIGKNLWVGGTVTAGLFDNGSDLDQDNTVEEDTTLIRGQVGVKMPIGGSFVDPRNLLAIDAYVTSGVINASETAVDFFGGADPNAAADVLDTTFLEFGGVAEFTRFATDGRLDYGFAIGAESRSAELDSPDLEVLRDPIPLVPATVGNQRGLVETTPFFGFLDGTPSFDSRVTRATTDDFSTLTGQFDAKVLFRPSEYVDFYAGLVATLEQTELTLGGDVDAGGDGEFEATFGEELDLDSVVLALNVAARIYASERLNIIFGASYIQTDLQLETRAGNASAGEAVQFATATNDITESQTVFRAGLEYTIENWVQLHLGFFEDLEPVRGPTAVPDGQTLEADAFIASAAFSF